MSKKMEDVQQTKRIPSIFFYYDRLLYLNELYTIMLLTALTLRKLDAQHAMMHLSLNLVTVDALRQVEDLAK